MQNVITETNTPHVVAERAATDLEGKDALSLHDVFLRVGALTRNLHDTLRQLGYDKDVEDAVSTLPDARARLDCIAALNGKAAERVLSASERAKSIQKMSRAESQTLGDKWSAILRESPNPRALWDLGRETEDRLAIICGWAAQVDEELTEIILAQDFHDLTGQVIQRITRSAQLLEEQLVKLLLDSTPLARRKEVFENTLSGPAFNTSDIDDVVASQGQVDDLLERLGF